MSRCHADSSRTLLPAGPFLPFGIPLNASLARFLVLSLGFVLAAFCSSFGTDVVTYHNDNNRTGANRAETILTQSNVNSTSFGKLFTLTVDSVVDAQPLYLSALTINGQSHNVLYVVTENDTVYAFDADTGASLWQVSLLRAGDAFRHARLRTDHAYHRQHLQPGDSP